MPAEIDYAFIADYARVQPNGVLTVVNASWMFLDVPSLPAVHRLSVAARIRSTVDRGAVAIRVVVNGPEGLYELVADGEIGPDGSTEPYGDGRVGLIFAFDTDVPIPKAGMYSVEVQLPDDDSQRMLRFEARTGRSS